MPSTHLPTKPYNGAWMVSLTAYIKHLWTCLRVHFLAGAVPCRVLCGEEPWQLECRAGGVYAGQLSAAHTGPLPGAAWQGRHHLKVRRSSRRTAFLEVVQQIYPVLKRIYFRLNEEHLILYIIPTTNFTSTHNTPMSLPISWPLAFPTNSFTYGLKKEFFIIKLTVGTFAHIQL